MVCLCVSVSWNRVPMNKKELSRMYCVGGVEAFGKVYHVSCVCVCVDGQSVTLESGSISLTTILFPLRFSIAWSRNR